MVTKLNDEFFVNRLLEASDYSEHNVYIELSDGPLIIYKESLKFEKVKKWCFLVLLGTDYGRDYCPLWFPEIPVLPKCVTLAGCSIWLDSADNNDVARGAERFEKLLVEIS